LDEATLRSLVPAVDQLASVFSEARRRLAPARLCALMPTAARFHADMRVF